MSTPSTKCRQPMGRKRISPGLSRKSRICGSPSAGWGAAGVTRPSTWEKQCKIILHQGQIPGRRELDSFAADHLGHEIVGQVMMERRDRAGGAHPEEAAGWSAVEIFGDLHDIVP